MFSTKPEQRLLHEDPVKEFVHTLGCLGGIGELLLQRFSGPPLRLAVIVDHDVPRRPEQVAAQAPGDVRGLLPDAKHRFLNHVFGQLGIPGRAQHKASQGGAMFPVDGGHHVLVQRHARPLLS